MYPTETIFRIENKAIYRELSRSSWFSVDETSEGILAYKEKLGDWLLTDPDIPEDVEKELTRIVETMRERGILLVLFAA